ncbi:NADH-quinone oxidoreductase protein [Medicago truncatula]|uniref:NADH-quinone oxidoreductase protein n=1 Tax=Medicago truncatula TaxID=3880 RepID=G7J2B9_MEDTR|nr:NADH-quinone oxidoreductase protein [Medicago truncatula]
MGGRLAWLVKKQCRSLLGKSPPMYGGEANLASQKVVSVPSLLHEKGAYGLVRINMELFFHVHSIFFPCLMILGFIQIIYADSTSFGQRNLKKRIAYSSVSHMSFIILGVGSISDIGTSYDKLRLLYPDKMGGMAPNVKNIHDFHYLIDDFSCIVA